MAKKKKSSLNKNRFISPKSFIKKPSFKKYRESIESIENKRLRKELFELQERQEKKYAEQEAKIKLGLMPSKQRQEAKAFFRQDPYRRVKPTPLQVGQELSTEQNMMHEMFGSSRSWGTGENLPKINGTLMPYFFGDELESETAESFGLKKGRTGEFFGIY